MRSSLRLVLLMIMVIGIAGCLALFVDFRNQWELGKTEAGGKVVQQSPSILPANPVTNTMPTLKELSADSCAAAGGKWNECGSLCRGKPAGTICAEICIPQCECTVGEKQCPNGYSCMSDLPAGEGVCRLGEGGGKVPAPPSKPSHEFKSADGITSAVWDDLGSEDGLLMNGFSFHGTSTAFENVISWSVVQSDDLEVARGDAHVNSPDVGVPGAFKVTGFFDRTPSLSSGTLNIFEASAKDGLPIHAVVIPVTLTTSTQIVTVYWANSKKDPNMLDCSKVYPVKHKVVTGGPANWTLTMNELLKGPTPWEKSQGYVTNIPEGVPLPRIVGREGASPILDFDQVLQQGVGGSCRTASIRAQIEQTWKNFGDNNGVAPIISINGRTEDILQP